MAAEGPDGNAGQRVIERAALDRVLARAAALQRPTGGEGGDGDREVISEAQLLEIAREVGLDPAAVQRAIAEERAGVPVPSDGGIAATVGGPAWSASQRVVPGDVPGTLAAIERWMLREERMVVQRRFPDRLTFERRDSAAAMLDRTLNLTGRTFDLSRAAMVAAAVVPADAGRVVVRLDADQRPSRRAALLGAGLVVAGSAVLASVWLLLMFFVVGAPAFALLFLAVAAAMVGAGGLIAALVVRQFRRSRERVQLAIEQLLDRLEHGQMPASTPSLLERLDRAIR